MFLQLLSPQDYQDNEETKYVVASLENEFWDYLEHVETDDITFDSLVNTTIELGAKVTDLGRGKEMQNQILVKAIIELLIDANSFLVNKDNVINSLEMRGVQPRIANRQTLTSLIALKDESLLNYILGDIERYIEEVMLSNTENVEESEEAIGFLFSQIGVTEELVDKVSSHRATELTSLEGIPTKYYSILASNGRLLASWPVVNELMNDLNLSAESYIHFLENAEWQCNSIEKIDNNTQITLINDIKDLNKLSIDKYVSLLVALDAKLSEYSQRVNKETWVAITKADLMVLNEATLHVAIEHCDLGILEQLLIFNESSFSSYSDHIDIPTDSVVTLLREFHTVEAKQRVIEQLSPEAIRDNDTVRKTVIEAVFVDNYRIESSILTAIVLSHDNEKQAIELILKYGQQIAKQDIAK